jgi:ferredoxin-type protein NapH
MSALTSNLGRDALVSKGWWGSYGYLVLRRFAQLAVLVLFLVGPWFGLWIVKGNLSSSMTLGVLPLTDSYLFVQSLAAGHIPEFNAIIGAALVAGFYFLVGGRSFCAWVCPINPVTDGASWLRRKLKIKYGWKLKRQTRYWILLMSLIGAALTGTMLWEWVNPVSLLQRSIIYSLSSAWLLGLVVFLFDCFVAERGWCSHLCPMGAFYRLLGHYSPLKVNAIRRSQCNDCGECYQVCPEPHILKSPLKDGGKGVSSLIASADCTNCGRCIEICSKDVFGFSSRYFQHKESLS